MPGVRPPLANRSASSARASQPVRYSSQPPTGNGPCAASHALTWSTSSRKSGSSAASAVWSRTAAGATSRPTGTCETSAPSRPVTQWIGASKWVPVCSPVEMLFQYQAGPRSSYRLISVSPNGHVWPNGSGNVRIGVREVNGAVRSTTSTPPPVSAAARSCSTPMPVTLGGYAFPGQRPGSLRCRRWPATSSMERARRVADSDIHPPSDGRHAIGLVQ